MMHPKEKILVVPMGGYAIVPINGSKYTDILSVRAETCVILVLESPNKFAIAHIDTPNALNNVKQIISQLGSKNLSAMLVGGDVGYIFDSSSIYNPIYEFLHQKNIPFKHDHYSYTTPPTLIWPFAYLALHVAGIVGPESTLGTSLVCMACFCAGYFTNHALCGSFDVRITLKERKIQVTTSSIQNLMLAESAISLKNQQFFKSRKLTNALAIHGLKDCSPK